MTDLVSLLGALGGYLLVAQALERINHFKPESTGKSVFWSLAYSVICLSAQVLPRKWLTGSFFLTVLTLGLNENAMCL